MSDDGPTALEIRNLKAGAKASQATGAVIASHTLRGNVARKEMHVLEAAGLDLQRFIWVHAQTETNLTVLLEAAQRGAHLELDRRGLVHPSTPQWPARGWFSGLHCANEGISASTAGARDN
jgi:predicted metal-dependent phosphotriesterase family hydrolase